MQPKTGDPRQARFERLYQTHHLRVLAYCGRRAPPSEAEDATSETFLVMWRRFDELPPDDQVLPYLYGVASRVIANQRRSIRRRATLTTKLQNLGVAPPDSALFVVLRQEQHLVADKAVRRLPPKDREIVMLDAWEQMSRQEIAQIVGLSKMAVDKRLIRAYKKLGRQLGPLIDPGNAGISITPVEAGGQT
jgi:RNA polymerase sigma-70 factor (ECF subfamily)